MNTMIESLRNRVATMVKQVPDEWADAMVELRDDLTAALEAGRGGEAVAWVYDFNDPDPQREVEWGPECPTGWRGKARPLIFGDAAPQQPTGEPMRDYVLDFITNTPEDVTHKRLVELGWTPPQQPPPVGVTDLVRDLASEGLRFSLQPCLDWSSKESIHQFWQGYFSRADRSIRERAASALSQQEAAPSVCPACDGSGDMEVQMKINDVENDTTLVSCDACEGSGLQPAPVSEPAASGGESLEMGEYDKVIHDAVEHGSGWMQNGKHIPRDQVYAASGEGWDSLRDELTAMATKVNVLDRLARVDALMSKARRLTTTGEMK